MYDSLRFFTVTGDIVPGAPNKVNVAQKVLNEVYKQIDTHKENRQTEQTTGLQLNDKQIISLCENAKNAQKFNDLWAGSTAGYDSHSDADLALVSILAFYTQDEAQLDRLFGSSGLYRHKWDREDYKNRTIQKAISGLTEVYKPFATNNNTQKDKVQAVMDEVLKDPLQIAAALQKRVPIWYDNARNYWMWNSDEHKYDRKDETDILCQIKNSLNVADLYKAKIKNEILESIKLTGRERNVLSTPKEWVLFKNGVVDISTKKEFIASPDYFFAACIPHNIGDSEETPTIDTLFEQWVGPEKKQLLYEICAYCLYDDYPIHRIFCFVGVGRNGKGQFMTLIRRFIGIENCCSTELDRLSNNQFEASKLYKKKAAFVGETNFGTMSRTNTLKQLSGGDIVSCEFKRADAFDFQNTAKILIATNALPPTTDRTEGFYRRWLIIEFNNKFQEGRDIINEIPEWEYENLARKCTRLLSELLERGSFTAEGTVEERAAAYEKKSNPITTFIDDCCELDDDYFCPTWYLYQKYNDFQVRGGHRKLTEREFSTQIGSMGYEIKQKAYSYELKKQFKFNVKDGEEDKRSNWRTVFGLRYKNTIEGVADVADVADISINFNIREKLNENKATSATSATNLLQIADWIKNYETNNKQLINTSNCVGMAIEYCKQFGIGEISETVEIFKKFATERKL
jgi:putative DNA primase/helicase